MNISYSGTEGRKEVMRKLHDLVGCRSGLDGGLLPAVLQIYSWHLVF